MDSFDMGCIGVCLLMVIIFVVFLGSSPDDTSDISDINLEDIEEEVPTLSIVNYTNKTFMPDAVTFVYYDMNSTKWNGCYGLNYTILNDSDGNSFILDHAETDIWANDTNYTFKYPGGLGIVYDNNTQTEIYNRTGCYYVHELRDDTGRVIKSANNLTLYDDSHQSDFIPSAWVYVYYNENTSDLYETSEYNGDVNFIQAYVNNTISDEENIIFDDEDVIGLLYHAGGNMSMYRYGFKKADLKINIYDRIRPGTAITLPNGTRIRSFSILSDGLNKEQKAFITDYEDRIDEAREKLRQQQFEDALDEMSSNAYVSRPRSQDKSNYGYFFGSNGYGIVYNP